MTKFCHPFFWNGSFSREMRAVVCVTSVQCILLVEIAIYYNTLYGGHIEGLVVGGRVFDYQLSPVWRQVAVVNTVTGELWSAFVRCWELFRLAPIRCADWTGAITQIVYLIFYPLLRQLQKRSTLSSAECLSSFVFPDKQGGPGSSCSCRSNPIWSHSVYFFI